MPLPQEIKNVDNVSQAGGNPSSLTGVALMMWNNITATWGRVRGNIAAGMEVSPPPYTTQLTHVPAGANQLATITFPATANKRWKVHTMTWSITQAAAGVIANVPVQLLDGATVIWQIRVGIQAAVPGVSNNWNLTGCAYTGSVGAAVTLAWLANPGAGNFVTVAAGAYLID
jgi:hypothetical protein